MAWCDGGRLASGPARRYCLPWSDDFASRTHCRTPGSGAIPFWQSPDHLTEPSDCGVALQTRHPVRASPIQPWWSGCPNADPEINMRPAARIVPRVMDIALPLLVFRTHQRLPPIRLGERQTRATRWLRAGHPPRSGVLPDHDQTAIFANPGLSIALRTIARIGIAPMSSRQGRPSQHRGAKPHQSSTCGTGIVLPAISGQLPDAPIRRPRRNARCA